MLQLPRRRRSLTGPRLGYDAADPDRNDQVIPKLIAWCVDNLSPEEVDRLILALSDARTQASDDADLAELPQQRVNLIRRDASGAMDAAQFPHANRLKTSVTIVARPNLTLAPGGRQEPEAYRDRFPHSGRLK